MDDLQRSQLEGTVFEALFGPPKAAESPLNDFTGNYLYKEIWTRTTLTVPERSMITMAMLAALGRDRELARHIEGALNIGISPQRINEILLHVAHYAGWPAGHNGQYIALKQYRKRATTKQQERLKAAAQKPADDLTRGEAGELLARLAFEQG